MPNAWLRGAVLTQGKRRIIGTMHPAFVMRTGFQSSPIFEADVAKAARIAGGLYESIVEHIIESPTRTEVEEYINECLNTGSEGFGLDIETPYKKDAEDEAGLAEATPIDLVGLSCREGECISIPPDMISLLGPLLSPKDPTICFAFNGTFDLYENLATHHAINSNLRLFDSMLATHLLYSEVMPQDLGTTLSLFTDLPYTKNLMMSDPIRYNAYDTFGVMMAGRNQLRLLQRYGMEKLFWQHEIGLLAECLQMKQHGARCNTRLASEYELSCILTLKKYSEWWKANIPQVDWSSSKQLIPLFDALGLPPQYNTKVDPKTKARTKVRTTDDDALVALEKTGKSGIPGLVRRMRAMAKAEQFVKFFEKDGKAHSSFLLHRHKGGRLQSVHPNMQNLSEELELAKVYPRRIIIGDEDDHCLINADFEQIEVWCMAWFSKDKKLLEMKEKGYYIHGIMYESLFKEPFFEPGKPPMKKYKLDKISPQKLLRAKTLPIGMMHGRVNLDEDGLSKQDQETIKRNFFSDHPEIFHKTEGWHARLERLAYRQHYIQNPFGRLRRFPNPKANRNELLQYPDQSTASDILRRNAFVNLHLSDFAARRVLTVHDQILVSCPVRNLVECSNHIKKMMELPIPEMDGYHIPVSLKVGWNWGDLMSIEDFLSKEVKVEQGA
jgi:DNA polymerase I-like protein with 3'-5' exonuclease and polymerase domains